MVRLEEIREYIVCRLCEGYIIDASTISTCLHSFCRSCLVRHLVNTLHCPVCGVLIHESDPFLNIRADPVLQRIVYKLVPGLLQNELQRREKFTASLSPSDHGESDSCSVTTFQDENISVCLKNVYHISEIHSPRSVHIENDSNSENSSLDTRYLLCPPAFTVGHLIKFIKYKFDLADHFQIVVFCDEEMLFSEYSLHQVSIMHRWERASPLELYYMVYDMRKICQSNTLVVESQRTEEENENTTSANYDFRFKSSQNDDVTEDKCTHSDDVIGSCDKCYEKSPLKALGLVPIKSTLLSHQPSPKTNRFLKPTGKMKCRDGVDTKPFVRSLNLDFSDSGIHIRDSPLDLSGDITCGVTENPAENYSAFMKISRSNSPSRNFCTELNDRHNSNNESHGRYRFRAETTETQIYNRQLMSAKVENHKYDDSQSQMYYSKSDSLNRISSSCTDDVNLYNSIKYDSTVVDMTTGDNSSNQITKQEIIEKSFTKSPPKYSSIISKNSGSQSNIQVSSCNSVKEEKSADLQRRPGRLTDFTINSIISRPFVPKHPTPARSWTPVKPKFAVYNDPPSPMQDDRHNNVKKSSGLRLNESQSSENAFTSQYSQFYASNRELNLDKITISSFSPPVSFCVHSSIVSQLSTEVSSTPISSAAGCSELVTPQDKIGIVIRHGRAMTLQDKLRMSSICKSKSDVSEEISRNQAVPSSKVLNHSLLQTPKSELNYKRIKPDSESAENNSCMVNSPSRFFPKGNSPQIRPSSAKRQRKHSHGLKMVDSNLPVSSSKGALPPVGCFSKVSGKKKLQFEWDNNKFNRSISENVKMERKYFT